MKLVVRSHARHTVSRLGNTRDKAAVNPTGRFFFLDRTPIALAWSGNYQTAFIWRHASNYG